MQVKNPSEVLDDVLRFIYVKNGLSLDDRTEGFTLGEVYREYSKSIMQIHVDSGSGPDILNRTYLKEVLERLIEDGYLRRARNPSISTMNTYFSTFSGRWFIYEGGYVGKSTALDAEKRKADFYEQETYRNARRLNLLTKVIAIGTAIAAAYYVLEILSKVYPDGLYLWTSFFVLASLGIITLITWLLLQEVKERKGR